MPNDTSTKSQPTMNPWEFWSQWSEMTTKMMANAMPYSKTGSNTSMGGEAFRQFYDWCTTMNRLWSGILANSSSPTPEQWFAFAGPFQENQAQLMKTFRAASEAYARALNMPTQSDITRVAELIVNLEEKVDTIDDALAQVKLQTAPYTTIMAKIVKLEEKVDAIDDTLTHVKMQTVPDAEALAKIVDLEQRLKDVESKTATFARQRGTK